MSNIDVTSIKTGQVEVTDNDQYGRCILVCRADDPSFATEYFDQYCKKNSLRYVAEWPRPLGNGLYCGIGDTDLNPR